MPETLMTGARETIALAALREITRPDSIGDLIDEAVEVDGVVTLHFACTMGGYPGWRWTVSLAELPGEEPSVLETELMPGDGALLAPDWIPWSDRLDEYRAAQEALGEVVVDVDELDEDDDLDDEDDEDELRRGGQRDGIEIDFLDSELVDSDLLAVSEDEQDEPEAEPEDSRPQKPRPVRRQKRLKEEQHPAEGE
jgi:hypothetical protein